MISLIHFSGLLILCKLLAHLHTYLVKEENVQAPMMYELHGKQYLVVNSTTNFSRDSYDHSKKTGALPRGYVVYALPERK